MTKGLDATFYWRDVSTPFTWEVTADGLPTGTPPVCTDGSGGGSSCTSISTKYNSSLGGYPNMNLKYTLGSTSLNYPIQPDLVCTGKTVKCEVMQYNNTECLGAVAHSPGSTCSVNSNLETSVNIASTVSDVLNFMLRFSYQDNNTIMVCTPAVAASNQNMNIHVCGSPSHIVNLSEPNKTITFGA